MIKSKFKFILKNAFYLTFKFSARVGTPFTATTTTAGQRWAEYFEQVLNVADVS